jgi:hypothetical protein
MKHLILSLAVGGFFVCSLSLFAQIGAKPTKKQLIEQFDFNRNGVLEWIEVTAGLEFELESEKGAKPTFDPSKLKGTITQKELPKPHPRMVLAVADFKEAFQHDAVDPSAEEPSFLVTQLVDDPKFDPVKVFGVKKDALLHQPLDTTSLWVLKDRKFLKVRRTIDDLNIAEDPTQKDKDPATKGALMSYTNDFNAGIDQWAFHGVIGLNLEWKPNPDLGATPEGKRPPLIQRPIGDVWFRPSVALDKVNTSHSSKDEIDALIYRATTGAQYDIQHPKHGPLDSFRFNISASYATDTSNDRKVLAGEFESTPIAAGRDWWNSLNSGFHSLWIFGLRPELVFHMEGGTVLDNAGVPALIASKDFLRMGGIFGLATRLAESAPFYDRLELKRLLLHVGLQYYSDVTNSGPDVDLFTSSANWALDPDGRYTITAEYRNGRSPLLLQRDNRITLGLGVKF